MNSIFQLDHFDYNICCMKNMSRSEKNYSSMVIMQNCIVRNEALAVNRKFFNFAISSRKNTGR